MSVSQRMRMAAAGQGGAAPEFIGATTSIGTSINMPAGVAEGDLLVYTGSNWNSGGAPAPGGTGWTQRFLHDMLSADYFTGYTRLVVAGDAASFSIAGGGNARAAVLAAFRGVSTFNTHSLVADSHAAPSLAGTAGEILTCVYGGFFDNSISAMAPGLTECGRITAVGADATAAIGFKLLDADGATGTHTVTSSGDGSFRGAASMLFSL